MEETKVFVLTAHRDHEDYDSSTEVLDVFFSHASAEKAMKKAFKAEKKTWKGYDNVEMDGVEETITSDYASLFDSYGNIEYTRFEITERVIKK